MNLTIKKYSPADTVGLYEKETIIDFLYTHLDEFGDEKEDIRKCVEYALNAGKHPGGLVLSAWDGDTLTGATILNKTGMESYIPGNILVYIATHADYRGKGVGKQLIQKAFDETDGDIALHVEPNNPAKFLYEKLGFTNKYLEMRWKRPS
jgi:[ribosomal protein S18]-alanine N-acetyltransferase